MRKEGSSQQKINKLRYDEEKRQKQLAALSAVSPSTAKTAASTVDPMAASKDSPAVPAIKLALKKASITSTKQKAATDAAIKQKKNTTPVVLARIIVPRLLTAALKAEKIIHVVDPKARTTFITAATAEGHQRIIELVKKLEIEAHTFASEQSAFTTMILGGIDSSTPTAEIEDEILALTGIKAEVTDMFGRGRVTEENKKPNPVKICKYRVSATREDMAVIMTAPLFSTSPRSIAKMWEKPHRPEVMQCFNCQRFGHSSRFCMRKARCVRCPQDHARGCCAHTKEVGKAYCVNCKIFDHPANYRQCPFYKAAIASQRLKVERTAAVTAERRRVGAPSQRVTSGLSFASAATGGQIQKQPMPSQMPQPPIPSQQPALTMVSAPILGNSCTSLNIIGTTLFGVPIADFYTQVEPFLDGLLSADTDYLKSVVFINIFAHLRAYTKSNV